MNFEVKMIVTRPSREIEFLESNIKKSVLSKFEIRIKQKGSPIIEGNSFFSQTKQEAKKIERLINKSENFRGKIYHKVHGVFVPLPIKKGRKEIRGKSYINEVLSLTTKKKEE